MTATEDRLRAVLAETANTVREDALRPLVVPGRSRRRWPRAVAPIAAAAAVVLVLGGEIAVEQRAGPPEVAGRAPLPTQTIAVGKSTTGMAYDPANGTVYFSASGYVPAGHGRLLPAGGILAMVDAAACNASTARGCAHVSRVPTGGRGAVDVAVDAQTHTVYVLNGASKTVAVINADTCDASRTSGCSPAAQVSLPSPGTGLTVNPRTSTIYVAETQPGGMSVINGRTCNASDTGGCATPPASVVLGPARSPFSLVAVDPGTNTVYLAVQKDLMVIDGRTCTGTDARGCANVLGRVPFATYPSGITIDAAAGTVYAASLGTMMVIDRNTCDARDTAGCGHPVRIRSGPGPWASAADPGTKTVYVTNEPNAVTMLNSATCNAGHVSTCPEFPAAFPVGSAPAKIAVDPAAHTVYVLNGGAGSVSVIDAATCNAADRHGCPRHPPAGTAGVTPFTCDPLVSAYVSGEPAGPPTEVSARVASGSVGGQAWSVWAKTGVPAPYGIEQGGLVLNGRWYALCQRSLSAGADASFALLDAGAHGIVYGFIQHPGKVAIRLGIHRPQWTPRQVLLPGTTFFIARLPRSACAYRGLAVNAWQGKKWGGYSNASYGTCLPSQNVSVTVGRGSWGPGYRGQHW